MLVVFLVVLSQYGLQIRIRDHPPNLHDKEVFSNTSLLKCWLAGCMVVGMARHVHVSHVD